MILSVSHSLNSGKDKPLCLLLVDLKNPGAIPPLEVASYCCSNPSENCLSSVFILLKVKVKVERALFSSYVLKLKKKTSAGFAIDIWSSWPKQPERQQSGEFSWQVWGSVPLEVAPPPQCWCSPGGTCQASQRRSRPRSVSNRQGRRLFPWDKKVLVRLIEGDITPGSTVRRDFEASVKQGSKRKKIIIKTNLRTEFWRFLRSVSLCFYSSTEEASGWVAIVACSTISAVFRPAYIYSIKADNRGLLTLFQILRGHPH